MGLGKIKQQVTRVSRRSTEGRIQERVQKLEDFRSQELVTEYPLEKFVELFGFLSFEGYRTPVDSHLVHYEKSRKGSEEKLTIQHPFIEGAVLEMAREKSKSIYLRTKLAGVYDYRVDCSSSVLYQHNPQLEKVSKYLQSRLVEEFTWESVFTLHPFAAANFPTRTQREATSREGVKITSRPYVRDFQSFIRTQSEGNQKPFYEIGMLHFIKEYWAPIHRWTAQYFMQASFIYQLKENLEAKGLSLNVSKINRMGNVRDRFSMPDHRLRIEVLDGSKKLFCLGYLSGVTPSLLSQPLGEATARIIHYVPKKGDEEFYWNYLLSERDHSSFYEGTMGNLSLAAEKIAAQAESLHKQAIAQQKREKSPQPHHEFLLLKREAGGMESREFTKALEPHIHGPHPKFKQIKLIFGEDSLNMRFQTEEKIEYDLPSIEIEIKSETVGFKVITLKDEILPDDLNNLSALLQDLQKVDPKHYLWMTKAARRMKGQFHHIQESVPGKPRIVVGLADSYRESR
jgi:hypothetical protein